TIAAEAPAVGRVARVAAKSQSGARKIARSDRKPIATPHTADAKRSRIPRPEEVWAGSSARQKRSAQIVVSAARSVYGYATPPYAQKVTAVKTKSAETRAVRSSYRRAASRYTRATVAPPASALTIVIARFGSCVRRSIPRSTRTYQR